MIVNVPTQEEVKEIKETTLIIVSFDATSGTLVTRSADYEDGE